MQKTFASLDPNLPSNTKSVARSATLSSFSSELYNRFSSQSFQQRQHRLRHAVGCGQHASAGLRENLFSGQVRRLGGEVGIRDRAVAGGHVLQGNAQRILIRLQSILLERAKPATENGDLADGFVDDGARLTGFPGNERGV